MKTISTTKELVIPAGFGALIFFVQLAVSTAIVTVTGIPGTGAVVIGVLLGYIVAIMGMLIRKSGVFIVAFAVFSVLSVPTIVMGPPGFYKLAMIATAIPIEACLLIFRSRKAGLYFGITTGLTLAMIAFYYILSAMGFPAAERLGKYLFWIIAVLVMETISGMWLGIMTYEKKLKKLKVVRQMQQ